MPRMLSEKDGWQGGEDECRNSSREQGGCLSSGLALANLVINACPHRLLGYKAADRKACSNLPGGGDPGSLSCPSNSFGMEREVVHNIITVQRSRYHE